MADLSALENKLHDVARSMSGDGLKAITGRVAYGAKQDTLSALDRDLPGRKFTNWRPRLYVKFTVTSPSQATISPQPQGPWIVLNSGRYPGRRTTRRGKRRTAVWGATRGRNTWREARDMITARTPDRIRTEILALFRRP